MPQFYKVLKADPIGDPFTPNRPNAKELQSFWCQVEGQNLPVMMNKQVPNTPSLTQGHYGVLELAHGKNTDYMKFTSMQVPQGTSIPTYGAAPTSETSSDLESRVKKLEDAVFGGEDTQPKGVAGSNTTKEDLEDIFGEDLDVQDIPPREG